MSEPTAIEVTAGHREAVRSWYRHMRALLWKDALVEWRTRERLGPTAFFVLLMLLVFNFAFVLGGAALMEIGPGVLWASYVFASLFGLNQTFVNERHNGCLDAVLLAAVSPASFYLSKTIGNFVFLLLVQLMSLPFFALFFNLSPAYPLLDLLPVLVLGSAGLAAVGTLFAAMCQHSRLREFMLPLLLLPVVVPLLISCVEATSAVFEQVRLGALDYLRERWWRHLQILAVYVVVFATLSLLLFDHVIEED